MTRVELLRTNSQIEFKTSMLSSSLCDYSDARILVSGTNNNYWCRKWGCNETIRLRK